MKTYEVVTRDELRKIFGDTLGSLADQDAPLLYIKKSSSREIVYSSVVE